VRELMAELRQIRDPIHDFISLDTEEIDIVNTPIFQRLRGIRQLAFAYLVYPGALHTRFEHSLGVCHVSGLIADFLNLDKIDRRIVRLAALLHDIGHGPFSHVSEDILEVYTDKSIISFGSEKDKIHELIMCNIIQFNKDIKDLIGTKDCDKIVQLLSSGYDEPLLKSIVSGPLDANKQDYLLRDSFFCGVKYGVFDIKQMIKELTIIEGAEEEKYLGISEDGVHALEQYILAKYYITSQVYKHKIRLITDQMIIRAIQLGIEDDNIEELRNIYAYDGTEAFIENYIKWDDATFMINFCDALYKKKLFYKILICLKERKLYKRLFYKPVKEFPIECREFLSRITSPSSRENRGIIENELSEIIYKHTNVKIDSKLIIINAYNIKSIQQSIKTDEPIYVKKKLAPIQIDQESAIFNTINQQFDESYVEVYAPIKYDTKSERTKLLRKLENPITEFLCSFHINKGDGHGND
jgi:HD superfamily phosphohydrolase